jgi:hypothetical protein
LLFSAVVDCRFRSSPFRASLYHSVSMWSKSIYWIIFDFMNWSLFVVFCNQQVNW